MSSLFKNPINVSLASLEPWNPFSNIVWWASCVTPITHQEIKEAIDNFRFEESPREDSICDPLPREFHIKRIAYLVVYGWDDPIEIDVGVPELCCNIDWIIIDGNHRLAAAFYREEKSIASNCSGSLSHIKERLNLQNVLD
jgi:hypothetical protein